MLFADARPSLQSFLTRLCLRSELGPAEREAVLALPATPRQVDAHRKIVGLGERIGYSCLVADGLVARYGQTEDGRRQLVSIHLPGDMADLYSLIHPVAPSALVALTPTLVFQVPHAALLKAASENPALSIAFWRDCVVDGRIMAEWLVSVGRRSARARIAHLFCEMALRYNQIDQLVGGSFPFLMTQEVMADALGVTPVHINRSLKSLREEGLIRLERTKATILDREGLAFAGDFDPTYLDLPSAGEALALSRRR